MRITTWNTRSLGTRQGGIEATKKRFINNASNDQDLIILTETRHLEREPFKIKWTKGRETILQTPARKTNQSIEDAITDGREEVPHIPNANPIQRYPQPLIGERGRGGGGIVVLAKKKEMIVLNSSGICRGHGIIALIEQNKIMKFFLIAIYAPVGLNQQRAFWKTTEEELAIFINQYDPNHETRNIFMTGDFNLDPSDIEDNEISQCLQNITQTWNLEDIGKKYGKDKYTWRGDGNRATQCSRIDILLADKNQSRHAHWLVSQDQSPSDHDWITFKISRKKTANNQTRVKDFILLKDEFLLQAQEEIVQTLILHSEEWLTNRQANFEELLEKHSNPTEAEKKLEFNIQNSPAKIMNLIIHKVKNIYNKVAKKEKDKTRKEMIEHNHKIMELIKKMNRATNDEAEQEAKDDLKEEKNNRRNHLRRTEIRFRERIDHFYRNENGKMTATTFRHTKEEKFESKIISIEDENQVITQEEQIREKFRAHLAASVADPNREESQPISQKMIELNIQHPAYIPSQEDIEEASRDFSIDEITRVIKNMQNESTPGPSGTTKSFFLWLISMIPNLFAKGLNEYLNHHTESKSHEWIKKRKIVFIPKPGRPRNKIESYRPISLLEVYYKVIAKLLANKLGKCVHKNISKSQFGFIPTRTVSEASTYLQTVINRARRTGEAIQIVFLDARAAFDLTRTEATTAMMRHLGAPDELVKKLNALTTKGVFCVEMYGASSIETKILSGTGQGDPASSDKYDATHEGNTLLYKAKRFDWALRDGDELVDPVSFADDTSIPVQLRSLDDYKELLNFFDSLSAITGYAINQAKTEILAFNTNPVLINEINNLGKGAVKNRVKHLGIWLTSAEENMEKVNFDYLKGRMEKATNRIVRRNQCSVYTRALLIEAILHSQTNHIIMSLNLTKEHLNEIQETIYKALWKKKNNEDAYIEGRHQIAKERTHAPIRVGGLNMRRTKIKAECLYFDSGIRHLRKFYDEEAPRMIERNITKLLETDDQQPDDLLTMGSRKIRDLSKKKTDLARIYTHTLAKLADTIQEWEEKQDTWEASAIGGSIYDHPFSLTKVERYELKRAGFTTVSQLFLTDEPRSFEKTVNINIPIRSIQMKINNIIKNIKSKRREFRNAPLTKNHIEAILIEKKITISKHLKDKEKMKQELIWEAAPSRQTRIRDGINIPEKEIYNQAYKKNYKSNFSEYQKSLNLSILNRTTWTKSKAFKSGRDNNNKCQKCEQEETIEHLFLDCDEYAYKLWENLQNIVQETKSKPGVVSLTQENIIYMKGIPLLSQSENEQLSEIIQEVKQQIYSSRSNERQIYENTRRNAHLRKCMVQIRKFREANSRDINFCEKLIEENDRRA